MKLDSRSDVYALMSAATASAAFQAAIETGLLWLLAKQPSGAEEVAQVLNIPGSRCRYWLQLLNALGILNMEGECYTPSPLVRDAILHSHSEASWNYLVREERERTADIQLLTAWLSEPGSIRGAHGLPVPKDYVDKMQTSLQHARDFTTMLFEVHQPLADELAGLLDLPDSGRLLDVGGGSGVVSMALLRQHPGLTATIVDLENVCTVGREIAARVGLLDRMTYLPANFMRDELPGGFDVVLQCDVGVSGLELYRRVWRALIPGGRLIIVEHLSPSDGVAPPERLEWAFLESMEDPHFSIPTLGHLEDQITQAGFHLSPKLHRLASGRMVVQAQKVLSPADVC